MLRVRIPCIMIYIYWKSILDGTESNLYTITQELIDLLFADKIIVTESERADRYDNGRDQITSASKKSITFNGAKLQRNPSGYSPKRRQVKAKRITQTANPTNPDQPIISKQVFTTDYYSIFYR